MDTNKLTGIHFLLSMTCTYECDHCFLYCSPRAEGVFSITDIESILRQARDLPNVKYVYFEGGEPFLHYPLLLRGAELCREYGFKIGIVTNCYWATTKRNALLWLEPLANIGVDDFSISKDEFHGSYECPEFTRNAYEAAKELGLPVGTITIDEPKIEHPASTTGQRGAPVVGGGVVFRGRAADKLTDGLPVTPLASFEECPHEELQEPSRLHIDPFGDTHICQGMSMGNVLKKGLVEVVSEYDHTEHAICGPIIEGGPAKLAEKYKVEVQQGYVDACHLCFDVRRKLLEQFPSELTPAQVYGIE